MAVASQSFSEVTGDRTDVAALSADQLERAPVARNPLQHSKFPNLERPRGQFELGAIDGMLVRAGSFELDR